MTTAAAPEEPTAPVAVPDDEPVVQPSALVPALPEGQQLDGLHTDRGDTTIVDQVVQKIAGMACREVPGVYAMGTAARRALSTITDRIAGSQQAGVGSGVSIQKGERQTAIEVSVVVEYGVSIVEVSQAIRRNVIAAVEHGTGLQVTEVNITVSDVHLPDDDRADAPAGPGASRLP